MAVMVLLLFLHFHLVILSIKKNSINPFYVFHLSPSLPSRVQSSPSFMNVPLLLLSVLLPPLVSVLLSLPLSSHPSFLDTSRVM